VHDMSISPVKFFFLHTKMRDLCGQSETKDRSGGYETSKLHCRKRSHLLRTAAFLPAKSGLIVRPACVLLFALRIFHSTSRDSFTGRRFDAGLEWNRWLHGVGRMHTPSSAPLSDAIRRHGPGALEAVSNFDLLIAKL